MEPAEIAEVLRCRQLGIKGDVLGDEAEAPPGLARMPEKIDAAHDDRAGVRPQKAAHDGNSRGLSRAVGTQKTQDFPGADGNVDPFQRRMGGPPIGFPKPPGGQDRRCVVGRLGLSVHNIRPAPLKFQVDVQDYVLIG